MGNILDFEYPYTKSDFYAFKLEKSTNPIEDIDKEPEDFTVGDPIYISQGQVYYDREGVSIDVYRVSPVDSDYSSLGAYKSVTPYSSPPLTTVEQVLSYMSGIDTSAYGWLEDWIEDQIPIATEKFETECKRRFTLYSNIDTSANSFIATFVHGSGSTELLLPMSPVQYLEKVYFMNSEELFSADAIGISNELLNPSNLHAKDLLVTPDGKLYINPYNTGASIYRTIPVFQDSEFSNKPIAVAVYGVFGYREIPLAIKEAVAKIIVIGALNDISQSISGGLKSMKFMSMSLDFGKDMLLSSMRDQYLADIDNTIQAYRTYTGAQGVIL